MGDEAGSPHAADRRPSLHGAAEFISWTWEMINDGYEHCGWSPDGTEVVVTNPERLQANVIPLYFRHGQYSSWVRALNAYNFKKTRPGQVHLCALPARGMRPTRALASSAVAPPVLPTGQARATPTDHAAAAEEAREG